MRKRIVVNRNKLNRWVYRPLVIDGREFWLYPWPMGLVGPRPFNATIRMGDCTDSVDVAGRPWVMSE